MSYLQARKNIYSIITNTVMNHIKDKYAMNNTLLKYGNNVDVFIGMPTNLISSTTLIADCDNGNISSECVKCLLNNGVKSSMIDKDNYNNKNNFDFVSTIRKTKCSGVCSCKITNVSLSTNLIFATGVNINGADMDISTITNNVMTAMTNVDKTESSTETRNWLMTLCGLSGVVFGGPPGAIAGLIIAGIAVELSPTILKDVQEDIRKTVSNISMLYVNSINQLISSSQEIIISGTGISVHNISMKSIQDIVMTASEQNCGNGNCVVDSINSIANKLIQKLTNNISNQFSGMFSYAFEQNKTLIISGSIFILGIIFMWVFLLFKKAATKQN